MLKKSLIIAGALAFFYTMTYLGLSLTGGYDIDKTGSNVEITLPTFDVLTWQLRYGRDNLYHQSDFISLFFGPLLILDRSLWHTSLPYKTLSNGSIIHTPIPPSAQLHPRFKAVINISQEFNERLRQAHEDKSSEAKDAVLKDYCSKIGEIYNTQE